MGQLENMLKMLFDLKKGGVMKKKDLANRLEVSEKQIKRYKIALEEFFPIESTSGPFGGYRLINSYFPFKELLTKQEIRLLKLSINSLSDFDNKKLQKALDKINYSILHDFKDFSPQIIHYSRINSSSEKLLIMEEEFYEAIINTNEVIIEYLGNNGVKSERRIEPYKLFVFKGEYYLVANCLKKKDLRFFKLVRIEHYIITNKKFEKTIDIEKRLNDYKENSIGIFSGKEYDLKLKISPPLANTIKERIWVENQIIEDLEHGEIIFNATMKGKPEIISWILSMRSYVKIIAPKALKDEIKEEVKKILENL